jgi:hypothetical protein
MQLAPMRYTKIEGTAVAVSVKSAAVAKAAVKELRHKKRELKFLRTALTRRLRALRPRSERRGGRPERSLLGRAFTGMGWLVSALVETATMSRDARRSRNPEEIESEIHAIDETLHNIEGCILQLQGRLLSRS